MIKKIKRDGQEEGGDSISHPSPNNKKNIKKYVKSEHKHPSMSQAQKYQTKQLNFWQILLLQGEKQPSDFEKEMDRIKNLPDQEWNELFGIEGK